MAAHIPGTLGIKNLLCSRSRTRDDNKVVGAQLGACMPLNPLKQLLFAVQGASKCAKLKSKEPTLTTMIADHVKHASFGPISKSMLCSRSCSRTCQMALLFTTLVSSASHRCFSDEEARHLSTLGTWAWHEQITAMPCHKALAGARSALRRDHASCMLDDLNANLQQLAVQAQSATGRLHHASCAA